MAQESDNSPTANIALGAAGPALRPLAPSSCSHVAFSPVAPGPVALDTVQDSLTAYEDRPRTEWLYEFCAQMVIVVARIIFTEEVSNLSTNMSIHTFFAHVHTQVYAHVYTHVYTHTYR